jgi:hypothetical protein
MQSEACQGTNERTVSFNTVISGDARDLATGFLDGSIADHLAQCDELKPCSNCARHGVLCSLVDPNAPPPVPTVASSSSSSLSSAAKKSATLKTVRLVLLPSKTAS